jgi:stage V sporulation protein B
MNMKKRSLFHQTAVLSCANLFVRALGFFMRILFARLMGAQAVGIMELSSSVHALLITPVTSGLPMAVSRMVAQRTDRAAQARVLRGAMRLGLLFSVPLALLFLPFSGAVARALGDVRTLPALLAFLPCLPVLALSTALNGYHYGRGSTLAPAVSELLEQLIRLLVTAALLLYFTRASLSLRAAFPAAGTFLGEAAGLALMIAVSFRALVLPGSREPALARTLFRLAVPMTVMRFLSTAMRTVNAVMIPLRLQCSGLSVAEATSRLGMLNGMAMPLVMMPSFLTGALAMVAAPAVAQRQDSPRALRRVMRRTLLGAWIVCMLCAAALFLFADFFAVALYRHSELSPLLRFLSPLLPIMGLHQVVNAMLSGLGLQRRALYAAITGNAFSLLGTYFLCAQPAFRLYGCALGMMLGQLVTLCLNAVTLRSASHGADASCPLRTA